MSRGIAAAHRRRSNAFAWDGLCCNLIRENLHIGEPLVRQIGCVIGTHAGPGAFGLAFFDKELVLE